MQKLLSHDEKKQLALWEEAYGTAAPPRQSDGSYDFFHMGATLANAARLHPRPLSVPEEIAADRKYDSALRTFVEAAEAEDEAQLERECEAFNASLGDPTATARRIKRFGWSAPDAYRWASVFLKYVVEHEREYDT